MAEVYLALSLGPAGFKKLVVLKRAKRELSDQDEFLEMFLDEARLAARLNHPNVVQTYEVGIEAGRYFIAMEYLDGQPLHRVRSRLGARWFPLGMQVRIFIEVLGGLHHAHELADFDGTPLGVVHRDATPQNVFVTYDGQIKIVDFGIAKVKGASSQTHAGILKGKVAYMAPEQARGDKIDRRADVFAVGVMLWEAIAGERMWAGMDDLVIVGRLAQARIPPLPKEAADEDPELARICMRALAPAPERRHTTAIELAHDLERWLDHRGEEVSARAVGRFVAAHFTEERAQMKALIERALGGGSIGQKAPAAGAEPEREPTLVTLIEPSPVSRPKPPPLPPRRAPVAAVSPAAASLTPVNPEVQEDVPETLRHSSVSMDAVRERSGAARFRLRGLGKGPLAVGSALVVAAAIGVGLGMFNAPPPPVATEAALSVPESVMPSAPLSASAMPRLAPPTASASLTASALPAVSAEPPPDAAELVIHVWPHTARVFMDGLPLSTGWYKGKLPKDGRVHRIRAEFPPFAPKEQVITATSDMIVNLALEARPSVIPPIGSGFSPTPR